jgi:hypothetical protein
MKNTKELNLQVSLVSKNLGLNKKMAKKMILNMNKQLGLGIANAYEYIKDMYLNDASAYELI